MPLRPALLLAAAGLLGGAPLSAQQATRQVAGDHFRVVGHGLGAAELRSALATVEPVWRAAAELLGVAGRDAPAEPLAVHLYARAEDYRRADRQRTGGRFQHNLACALWDGTAHVALQPEVTAEYLASHGLPRQTLRLLAHEATHLARHRLLPAHRSQPRWFADALAFTVSHRVLHDAGLAHAMPREPQFATALHRVHTLATQDALPTPDVILARETATPDASIPGRGFFELYACHLTFGRFLQQHRGGRGWQRACAALRALDPAAGAADIDTALRGALRPGAALERAFRAHVAALTPHWTEEYRSLCSHGDGGWRQIAYADTNAVAWRTAPTGSGEHRLDVRLTFLPGATAQANILLGRHADGFVQVALQRGAALLLLRHVTSDATADAATDAATGSAGWQTLARRDDLDLQSHDHALGVRWDTASGVVTVERGGEVVLRAEVEHDLSGPWGLGALAGSAVDWRAVDHQASD